MVRARLRVKITLRKKKGNFIVTFATHLLDSSAFRDDYRENLAWKLLETLHEDGSTAEYNWEVLKGCVLKAGEETIGRVKRPSLTGF